MARGLSGHRHSMTRKRTSTGKIGIAEWFKKSVDGSKCLLPLANTPLIEYTCEFLANAGVEEVILYCGNHTDQVEEYFTCVPIQTTQ